MTKLKISLFTFILCVVAPLISAQETLRTSGTNQSSAQTAAPSASSQTEAARPSPSPRATEAKANPLTEERTSVTKHTARIGGQIVRYTATSGTLVLRKEDGSPRASMFYVAYTRDGVDDATSRPVTFTFNGGPGSSSVWLHLGALGPRRVLTDDDGNAPVPPARLVENEFSILDDTDLVFIDPVGTGYSRAVSGEDPKQFYGFNGDIESVGEFIRVYASRNRRWSSPKFLAGESYGTMRAAALSGHLQNRYGMYLNGIVLISTVLDFSTIRFDGGNMLPYILIMPSYTATAWYHKRLAPDLQADLRRTLAEAESFAIDDYTNALMRGDSLSTNERAAVVAKYARLTGLSPVFVERANLLVSQSRFAKELLRDDRRTVGRLDSRFQGIDSDAAGDNSEYDPSYAAIQGVYSSAFNSYVRGELNYENDLTYEVLTGRVQPWSYAPAENRYVTSVETLRAAMTQNRALKVFVASGYYDMATPYFAAMYTFRHTGLDPTLRPNLQFGFYESGHMLYMHKASLAKMKSDVARFIKSALN